MSSNFSVPFFINSKDRVSGDVNNAQYIFNGLPNDDKEYTILLKEFE